MKSAETSNASRSGSFFVALGILLSRISGLIRERVFAHYFGNSDAGDAFKAALKIPNFLQNLFGEGVLSASFIPVYSRLLAIDEREAAKRVAWSVGGLLAMAVSVLVLAGTFATPHLIDMIAPGFEGAKRDLTIHIVRILFPGTGALVLSAWCLGILNSHRQFFLSYSAPVLWNLAIIITIIVMGQKHGQEMLAVDAAWGLFAGSLIQFLVQLPFVLKFVGLMKKAQPQDKEHVRGIVRSFLPVVTGRGVVQISAYIDNMIASLLPTGAVSAISYAQTLYLLPISLFGMSVSASELPELSSVASDDEAGRAKLRHRLEIGLTRMGFFVIPSVIAFFLLGDVIAGAIFQTGEFRRSDSFLVWGILAAASIALLPATRGRLISSAFYALRDVTTPLKISVIRVLCGVTMGLIAALKLPEVFDVAKIYGTAGLTFASGCAAWIEYTLLKRSLEKRIGTITIAARAKNRAWGAASIAGAMAFAAKIGMSDFRSPIVIAAVVLSLYGGVYFVVGALLGLEEARRVCGRLGLKFS